MKMADNTPHERLSSVRKFGIVNNFINEFFIAKIQTKINLNPF